MKCGREAKETDALEKVACHVRALFDHILPSIQDDLACRARVIGILVGRLPTNIRGKRWVNM